MQLNYPLTTRQAAAVIGVSVTTLKRMRYAGLGPVYAKIGARTFRYRAADIENWLRDQRRLPEEVGPDGGLHV